MMQTLTREQQTALVEFYQNTYPDARIISRAAHSDDPNPNYVFGRAKFHKHIILDGRRITPSASLTHAPTSIVQMDLNNKRYVGQIFHVFTHKQPKIEKVVELLDVHWFCRLEEADTKHWDP